LAIPSWARTGAKVVCIANDFKDVAFEQIPVVGERYTLRKVEAYGSMTVVYLQEIRNDKIYTAFGMMERGFTIAAFKPLVEKTIEDDIALFAPFLIDTKIDEHA
jgi:hypothetical protein